MQASDECRNSLRGPLVVGVVAGLHVLAISGFLAIQGCGTKQPAVEPPSAPVMPPRGDDALPNQTELPRPSFQPPVAVEPAPASLDAASVQTYTVGSGDSLSRIASRFGVSAREIAQLNDVKDANKIRVGQKLKLPPYASEVSGSAPSKPAAKPKTAAKKPAAVVAGAGEYLVQSGDSLSKIAARNGTTVKAIKETNNLQSDLIRIGQKLTLPGASAKAPEAPAAAPTAPSDPVAAPVGEPAPADPAVESPAPVASDSAPAAAPLDPGTMPFEYVVRPGETIEDIARSFAVLKQDILAMNGLAEGAEIRAGQKIKIPVSAP